KLTPREVPPSRNVTRVTVSEVPPSSIVENCTTLTVPLTVAVLRAPRIKNWLPQPESERKSAETTRTDRRRFTTATSLHQGGLLNQVYTFKKLTGEAARRNSRTGFACRG